MNDEHSNSNTGSARQSHTVPFETPYPTYDVLSKWNSPSFDEPTRRVLEDRLANIPSRRFFDADQYAILRVVIDCILPQAERVESDRIPVEAFIDAMLFDNQGSGTRYEDALTPRHAWPRGLTGIENEAWKHFGRGIRGLDDDEQQTLLTRIDAGKVDAELWRGLHPKRFFRHVLLKEAVKIYYAHPSAWNEIGFGGPAAPRGYVRLGPDARDPWEAEEKRPPQKLRRMT